MFEVVQSSKFKAQSSKFKVQGSRLQVEGSSREANLQPSTFQPVTGEIMVPTSYYLLLSAVLFVIGTLGVLLRRNLLIIFMSVEMMLNAVNLTFVALSRHFLSLNGQIFVLMAMIVAAAEVAIGLAIVMAVVRHKDTTNIEDVNLLKG